MEAADDTYSNSCNFVGNDNNNNNNNNNGITDVSCSVAVLLKHLEEPLQNDRDTDGQECQSVEDANESHCCSTDKHAEIVSHTQLTEKSECDLAASVPDDDAESNECVTRSDEAVEVESVVVKKNADVSFVHKDLSESDAYRSSSHPVPNAHQLETVHTADQAESLTASEQAVNSDVKQRLPVTLEAVDNHFTFTALDTFADMTSRQNVLISRPDVQSEMEDANSVMTDSSKYEELKQLCHHLQVTS